MKCGPEVFFGAALWLATFRGIVMLLSSASSRPSFSESGRVSVIHLDAALSTVFRNIGNYSPSDTAQHPSNTFVLSPGLERNSM